MSNNPIIKALKARLESERKDLCFEYAKDRIGIRLGHEAATERLMAVIEKAVEFVDFIEFHESKYVDNGPEETTVYLQKAREFLTTLADASGEMNKEGK